MVICFVGVVVGGGYVLNCMNYFVIRDKEFGTRITLSLFTSHSRRHVFKIPGSWDSPTESKVGEVALEGPLRSASSIHLLPLSLEQFCSVLGRSWSLTRANLVPGLA